MFKKWVDFKYTKMKLFYMLKVSYLVIFFVLICQYLILTYNKCETSG